MSQNPSLIHSEDESLVEFLDLIDRDGKGRRGTPPVSAWRNSQRRRRRHHEALGLQRSFPACSATNASRRPAAIALHGTSGTRSRSTRRYHDRRQRWRSHGRFGAASYQSRVELTILTTDYITGSLMRSPTTVARAAPESKPKRLMAAATASSKKLLAPMRADGPATQCASPAARLSRYARPELK